MDPADVETAAAPPEADSGTSAETPPEAATDQPEFEAPFKLEDVPEEYRGDVERYVKQTQAAFTRKTMELAEIRSKFDGVDEELIPYLKRLNDDDAEDAINELADKFGLVPADVEAAIEQAPEPSDELATRVEQLEAKDAKEAEAAQADKIRQHVFEGIDLYAKEIGVDEIPEPVAKQLIANSLALPARSDGMPDIGAAVENWKQAEAAVRDQAVQAYLASKEGDSPDLSGSSGVQQFDTSTDKGRLEKANAIAERALAQHAPE